MSSRSFSLWSIGLFVPMVALGAQAASIPADRCLDGITGTGTAARRTIVTEGRDSAWLHFYGRPSRVVSLERAADSTGVPIWQSRSGETSRFTVRSSSAGALVEMRTSARTSTGTLHPTSSDPVLTSMTGAWETVIGPGGVLRVVARLSRGPCGIVVGTLDSPDQGQRDLPLTQVSAAGDSVIIEANYLGLRIAVQNPSILPPSEREVLRGVLTQNGTRQPLTLQRGAGLLTAPRPQHPLPPYPYIEREVRFSSAAAGISIQGTLTIPHGGSRHPAVVLISGSGAQDRDESIAGHKPFLVLADHLTRNGFAVLRADDRGAGMSGGDPLRTTLGDVADDVRGALAYLRTQPEVDTSRLGLVGHSEGGYVAPMVASGDSGVRFVILLAAPAVPGRELLLSQRAALMRASGESSVAVRVDSALLATLFDVVGRRPPASELDPMLGAAITRWLGGLGDDERAIAVAQLQARTPAQDSASVALWTSPWFQSFFFHQPAPLLLSLRVPIYAIHGERDLQVPAEPNAMALTRLFPEGRRSLLTHRIMPGINHMLQPARTGLLEEYRTIDTTIAPEVLQALTSWMERFRR